MYVTNYNAKPSRTQELLLLKTGAMYFWPFTEDTIYLEIN